MPRSRLTTSNGDKTLQAYAIAYVTLSCKVSSPSDVVRRLWGMTLAIFACGGPRMPKLLESCLGAISRHPMGGKNLQVYAIANGTQAYKFIYPSDVVRWLWGMTLAIFAYRAHVGKNP